MMVDQSLGEVVESYVTSEKPLIKSDFQMSLSGKTTSRVHAQLYDTFILITKVQDKKQKLKVAFDFDLIAEFVTPEDPEKKKKLASVEGIRLEKNENTITLTDISSQKQMALWIEHISKRLNLRGFHEIFKPIKKVGKGNFASVYLVVKHEDKKKYAVKAFSKEGTYSEDKGKESLINQIEMMRLLGHKNLMKLYEVYESANSIYISVELLEGGQLYDKIKGKYKFTSHEIKMIMRGLLEGLEQMHAQNIMHRDLKPENILLRKEGDFDVVIADFGLAEKADSKEYLFVRCGTPGYVAPEVVNLKDLKSKYTTQCDLFSLGVIFHILAMKRSPFPGKQYDEVLQQNRKCKFNFEAPEYQKLPESWVQLMKGLLQKDPQKRLTASQALDHDFFTKDSQFTEINQMRQSSLMSSCQSPLMTTSNNERKVKGRLRDDSCLKFKMKDNMLTGRLDEIGENTDQFNSPLLKPKASLVQAESRFKK